MNKDKLLASPFFIVSLCAGCSLSGDTALDSPATVTQASSPANVVIRNQSTDFGDVSGIFGGGRPAIMPGDLDGDGYGDMVVVEGFCAHIIYGAATLPHTLDTANTATLVGSSEMQDSCGGRDLSANHTPAVQADWLGLVAAGDVDRDGFADFLVFFDGKNDMYESTATVHLVGSYLVYGGPTRLAGRHLLAETSAAFFANAYAPTGLGDVNGDGFADIGALDAGPYMPDTAAGTVAVFFGSATRFTGEVPLDQAGARLSIPAGYQFGRGLHSAGDLNGDGYADFLVGKANADAPYNCDQSVTRVWIVLGGTGVVGALSLDTMPFIEGKIVGPYSDYAVPLGDLDGDGFDDLAVSTCHNPGQTDDPGSDTNILFGRPDLSTLQGPWDVTFPNTTALVSADVDGDGIRDLIMANPYANNGNGVVYIRRGTGARVSGSIDPNLGSLAIPSAYREFFGLWLIVGSDVDKDGLADILVGADVATDANGDPINDPLISTGHAYLLRGAAIKASLSP